MGKLKTTEQFINEATEKFGFTRFDYSLVNYNGVFAKVKIKCNSCETIFEQTPDRHIQNIGDGSKICPHCGKKLTTEKFIEKAKKIHENRYDYSLVNYKHTRTKIILICNKCTHQFNIIPHDHIHNNQGCPKCKFSKGELIIEKFLRDNFINYIPQKKFEGCKNKNLLKFDFYIPIENLCIEYDGIQHFIPYSYKNNASEQDKIENLKYTQKNDNIKNEFCESNGIQLIRLNSNHDISTELSFLIPLPKSCTNNANI